MLAEQPPTDVAGLLRMLHNASPVIRRRLSELLHAIKEASREPTSKAHLPELRVSPEAASPAPAMEVDKPAKELVPPVLAQDSLWQRGMRSLSTISFSHLTLSSDGGQTSRAPTSTLFGASQIAQKREDHTVYAASRSALFVDGQRVDSVSAPSLSCRVTEPLCFVLA